MRQIVSDAQEPESLVDEFGNARRAEEEDAEDDVVLPGCGDQLVRRLAKLG
jgi:hypothetical protein